MGLTGTIARKPETEIGFEAAQALSIQALQSTGSSRCSLDPLSSPGHLSTWDSEAVGSSLSAPA